MIEATSPDIEIYVANVTKDQALEWLESLQMKPESQRKKKGQPKNAFPYRATFNGVSFTIMVFEEVSKGFTSIWFDYDALPWKNDLECALEAAKYFEKNCRVTAGSWNPNAGEDDWVNVSPDGNQEKIVWTG